MKDDDKVATPPVRWSSHFWWAAGIFCSAVTRTILLYSIIDYLGQCHPLIGSQGRPPPRFDRPDGPWPTHDPYDANPE